MLYIAADPPRKRGIEEIMVKATYWVPGVNHLGTYGRWAFAEFTEVYQIEADFKAKAKGEFKTMIDRITSLPPEVQ